jgi:hypothetical protein
VVNRRALAGVAGIGVLAVAGLVGLRATTDEPTQLGDDPVAPAAPILTSVDAVPDGLRIRWDAVEGAEGYQVRRLVDAESGDVDGQREAKPAQTALIWDELDPGEHCFQVVATTADGESDPSATMCAVAHKPADQAPALSPYIAIYGSFVVNNVGSYERALRLQDAVKSVDERVRLAKSSEMLELHGLPEGEFYVVYGDGFQDEASAQSMCQQVLRVANSCEVFETPQDAP